MQEILEILKSINFWTIAGSVAAVAGVMLTFIQVAKSRNNKAKDAFILTVINLSKVYEQISLCLLGDMEHLSRKVESVTQNDDEGTKIQISINASALELRVKANELLNNTKSPICQEQKINDLRDAAENIYQNIASILNNKGGSLSMLSEAIETFTQAKNRLL